MLRKKIGVPILVIGFNRPDLISAVLKRVMTLKPTKVYVAIDGPRPGNEADKQKCKEVEQVIKEVVTGCLLKTKFSKKNQGCKWAPYQAIDWFFQHEERGIILEDDVLADQSFFYFCEELLARYAQDDRVAGISGNNFQFGKRRTNDSYYFSRFSHTCGWATWRRAWQKYDINMENWPNLKKGHWLKDILVSPLAVRYWTLIFDRLYSNKIKTAWDYQWTLMCWSNNMLSILPNQNLITNIGFGSADATHTKSDSKFAHMAVEPLKFPLKHPIALIRDAEADSRTQRRNYVLWKELGVIALQRLGLR